MARDLTEKQQRFVEAYVGDAEGNATTAARIAGYSGNDNSLGVTGSRLLADERIRQEITNRRKLLGIPDRAEVMCFFADIMRTEQIELKYRMRAAENVFRALGLHRESCETTSATMNVVAYLPDNGRYC